MPLVSLLCFRSELSPAARLGGSGLSSSVRLFFCRDFAGRASRFVGGGRPERGCQAASPAVMDHPGLGDPGLLFGVKCQQ